MGKLTLAKHQIRYRLIVMTDSNSELNALPVGEKYYPKGNYEIMRKEAMENSDKFWSNIASELSWSRTWD